MRSSKKKKNSGLEHAHEQRDGLSFEHLVFREILALAPSSDVVCKHPEEDDAHGAAVGIRNRG